MYFSLKWVSYPDWTLIYGGVNNSIPLKTDWIVSHGVGDEVQTIFLRIFQCLIPPSAAHIDPGTSQLYLRNKLNRRVNQKFNFLNSFSNVVFGLLWKQIR